jgi:hypothetical protein
MEERKIMIEEIKKWIINVANDFCNSSVATSGTICDETVETAGAICDGTRKANAEFVKAIMGKE